MIKLCKTCCADCAYITCPDYGNSHILPNKYSSLVDGSNIK
jgi:hypothetical protein